MTDSSNNDSNNLSFFESIYHGLITDETGNSVLTYTSEHEEYDALINGAGLYDLTGNVVIEMRGSDSLEYLHRISTNSLLELKENELIDTVFTNEKGRIIDRGTVLNLGESLRLIGSRVFRNKLLGWINKYVIMEDIKVADLTDKFSVFEIMGSQSKTFLSMIFGDNIEMLKPGKIIKAMVYNYEFLVALKNDFNINKYLILSKTEDTRFLLNFMFEHKSVFDFKAVGQSAYNNFRISAGIPQAPNEINDNYNPHEANLLNYVSFTKGCYIGQEVIARLDTYSKVQKKLSLLAFDQIVEDIQPMVLFDEEEREVGRVTSISHSFQQNKTIAMAYVNKELSQEGTKLTAAGVLNKNKYSVTICSFGRRT